MYPRKFINIILSLIVSGTAFSQDLDKVVFVESNFQPIVENAERISSIPLLSDTLKPQPAINYSVLPSRIQAQYEIRPIKPAKLVGSPLDELYKSKIKLGIGNYFTPLAEFSINNLRSKEYAIGAYVYHKSSHTKQKLKNEHKVPAGYGVNKVLLYGKRFYKDVNVEGEVAFNSHKNRFYGYNTSNFIDTLPSMEAKDIRQWYKQLKGKAEVYSTTPGIYDMQYRVGLIADYFGDDFSNSQSHVDIPGQLSLLIKSFKLELNARYHYFNSRLDTIESKDYAFQFRPVLRKTADRWEASVGLNTYLSSYGDANIYPEAKFSFVVLKDAMEAYFGFNGDLELNHFSKIAGENEFIRPGLSVKNTSHKIVGFGGVKGQLSSKSAYRVFIRFDSMDDQYFFVNDTSNQLENRFLVEYSDVELFTLGGEIWYSPLSNLDFYLKGNYNAYNLSGASEPWHTPLYNLSFRTNYNYKDKIFAGLELIHQGERLAKNYSDLANPIKLNAIWDVNLKFEYKYSQVLSAFLDVYNLIAQEYYQWNQYPSQKINFLVGASYKF